MKLIIGLGNPGKDYEYTRHNFGFLSLDSLANKYNSTWKNHKASNSLITDFKFKRERIILVKPQTFMNNSGSTVSILKKYYKLKLDDIIVIYDDIDLPFDKIRISKSKSAGGHNGVDSIIKYLKSKEFIRIRLGIGPQKGKAESFVLKEFNKEQKNKLQNILDNSNLDLEEILDKDYNSAANKYN